MYDLAVKQAHALPVPKGINSLAGAETAFSHDGARLLYLHEGANAPNDLWTYDLPIDKPLQITRSLVGGVRSEDMVDPFLVHYASKDGKWQIPASVYVPYNAERNGQNAAIVYIYGAPTAQTLNSFNRGIQYLVNQGYFVIVPIFRGSTGFGKEFEDANRFDMGGGDLEDVISAAEWIKKTGFIRSQKSCGDGRQLWRLSHHDGRHPRRRIYGLLAWRLSLSSTGSPNLRTKIRCCGNITSPLWAIR